MNVNPRIAPARNSKAMITGAFVRNAWYVAMWGEDLPREQVAGRTILNEAVALFRKADGSIAALADRCAHRFAPLPMGKRRRRPHSVRLSRAGIRRHRRLRAQSARQQAGPAERQGAQLSGGREAPGDLDLDGRQAGRPLGHSRLRPARHARTKPCDEARLDQDQSELRARDRQPARSQPHVVSARRAPRQSGHGRCRGHRRAGRRRSGGRPPIDEFDDPGAVRHPDAEVLAGRQVEHDPLDRAG